MDFFETSDYEYTEDGDLQYLDSEDLHSMSVIDADYDDFDESLDLDM